MSLDESCYINNVTPATVQPFLESNVVQSDAEVRRLTAVIHCVRTHGMPVVQSKGLVGENCGIVMDVYLVFMPLRVQFYYNHEAE